MLSLVIVVEGIELVEAIAKQEVDDEKKKKKILKRE